MKSNLQIKSNLMVEKEDGVEVKGKKHQMRYLPGDLAALIEPSKMRDNRVRAMYFDSQQIHEYEQTVFCLTCRRPCAGTCRLEPPKVSRELGK